MNETAVQAAIAVTLRAMSDFSDDDVTINDWKILDQSSASAPYAIIENAVNINTEKETSDSQNSYDVPVNLFVAFTEWKATLDAFRNLREAVFAAFIATGTAMSANGLEGTTIRNIRTGGEIGFYFDRGLSAELQSVSMPAFVSQQILFRVEEF